MDYLQRCLLGTATSGWERGRVAGDGILTHPLPLTVRGWILPSLTSAFLVSFLFVQRWWILGNTQTTPPCAPYTLIRAFLFAYTHRAFPFTYTRTHTHRAFLFTYTHTHTQSLPLYLHTHTHTHTHTEPSCLFTHTQLGEAVPCFSAAVVNCYFKFQQVE